MKVILLENIKKLGRKFDIKHVTDGYGRNFLLPRRLARLATQDALDELDEELRKREMIATEELEHVEGAAESLDGLEIILSAKVEESGTLYAAVSQDVIQKRLKELGFDVPKKAIKINDPIKELGEYKVMLEFDHGLEAELKLIVEEEKG